MMMNMMPRIFLNKNLNMNDLCLSKKILFYILDFYIFVFVKKFHLAFAI